MELNCPSTIVDERENASYNRAAELRLGAGGQL